MESPREFGIIKPEERTSNGSHANGSNHAGTTNATNHLQNLLNGLVSKLGIKQFTGSDIIQSHKSIQARALEVRKTKSSDSINNVDDLDNFGESLRPKKKQKKRKLNFSPSTQKDTKQLPSFSLDSNSFRSILQTQQPLSAKILALQSILAKPAEEQPQASFSSGSFSNKGESYSNSSFGDLALLSQISTDSLASLITVSEELDSQSDSQQTDLHSSYSYDETVHEQPQKRNWKHEDFFICTAEWKKIDTSEEKRLCLDFSIPPLDWKQRNMTNVKSTIELLKENIASCDLDTLDITGPMFMNDDSLRIIADSLPKLQSLFIHFSLSPLVDFSLLDSLSNQIEGQGLEYLLEKCTKLDYLYLNNCRKLKHLHLENHSLRSLFLLGGKNHELTCSKFIFPSLLVLDLDLHSSQMETMLPHIFEGTNSLVSLSLACPFMTDAALLNSINKCSQQITTLCFRNCKLITEASLSAVFSHLRNLNDLDISLCSLVNDKALEKIVKLCQNLTTFRIAFHSSSVGISGEGAQLLVGLPNLKNLYFTTTGGACKGLTNLLFKHDKLELLDLTNCVNLSQLTLSCPKLEYLILNGCNSVEIADVNSLPALHTIAIDGIRKSKERYLRTIFKRHKGAVHFVTQL